MLTDKKINTYADNVKSLSDYPSDDGITAEQLKAIFDGRTDKEIKNAHNGLIDALVSTTGASSIGSSGGNVQKELDEKAPKVTPTFDTSIKIAGFYGTHIIGEGGNSSGRTEIRNTRYGETKSLIVGDDNLKYSDGTKEYNIYSDKNKPTKTDVGLGDVDNTADVDKPISTATQMAINTVESRANQAYNDILAHTNDLRNPHNVTKDQIGLSNVDNTSDMDKPISKAVQSALDGKTDKTYVDNMLDGKVSKVNAYVNNSLKINGVSAPPTLNLGNDGKVAVTAGSAYLQYNSFNGKPDARISVNSESLTYKVGDVEHDVYTSKNKPTKSDMGLSKVDNTSDADKPISTATQTALSSKADKSAIPTKLSQLTNDSGFATTSYVDNKVVSVYRIKGSVANYDALPTANQVAGDIYISLDTGNNYMWTGTRWDNLGKITEPEKNGSIHFAVETNPPVMNANDIWYIVDDVNQKVNGIVYSNMKFAAVAPTSGDNWAMPDVIGGLSVGDNPKENNTFFGDINN